MKQIQDLIQYKNQEINKLKTTMQQLLAANEKSAIDQVKRAINNYANDIKVLENVLKEIEEMNSKPAKKSKPKVEPKVEKVVAKEEETSKEKED